MASEREKALESMLDRIANIDGVEFDPRCEENIADGVHALSDYAGQMEAERDTFETLVKRFMELTGDLREHCPCGGGAWKHQDDCPYEKVRANEYAS